MKASLFSYVISAALSFATIATASKPVENDTISSKKAEISERNVMLNASDANKPREIQIGLPSEDVNVYENGLPAVYSSAVHKLDRKSTRLNSSHKHRSRMPSSA